MTPLDLAELSAYIEQHIGPQFHQRKLDRIRRLTLNDVIKRKNPYLFRAKGSSSAHDFIKSVLDASLSSGEETSFGDFLENVAIFVASKVHGGRKSAVEGIDLEFEDGNAKYLVTIKSGPNWGNSGQKKNMDAMFTKARRILQTSGGAAGKTLIFVEGCCYGVDDRPQKDRHERLCGQRFWALMSGGDEGLYRDLIEPLGHGAKSRAEELQEVSDAKLNDLTGQFVSRFCLADGAIDWAGLIRFNSGNGAPPSDEE